MIFTLISAASTAPQATEAAKLAPEKTAAQKVVESTLVEPMDRKDLRRSKFSRSMRAPVERRVRLLDQSPRKDSKGELFLTFAIDSRHGWIVLEDEKADKERWILGSITGCVYPDSKAVFIDRGEAKYPGGLLLGKRVKQAEKHVCKADSQQLAVVTKK